MPDTTNRYERAFTVSAVSDSQNGTLLFFRARGAVADTKDNVENKISWNAFGTGTYDLACNEGLHD